MKRVILLFFASSCIMSMDSRIAYAVGERLPIVVAYQQVTSLVYEYHLKDRITEWRQKAKEAKNNLEEDTDRQFGEVLRDIIDMLESFSHERGDLALLINNSIIPLYTQCYGLETVRDKAGRAQACHSYLIAGRNIINAAQSRITPELLNFAREHQEHFPKLAELVWLSNEYSIFRNQVISCINAFADTLLIK